MLKKKVVDRIFIITLGVVGALIFGMAATCFNSMPDNCTYNTIHNCLTGVLTIGAVLLTMSLCYGYCNLTRNCYASEANEGGASESYLGISAACVLVLCILLMVTGGELTKHPECSTPSIKFYVWFMFSLCVILLILISLGLTYINQGLPGQLLSKTPAPTTAPSTSHYDDYRRRYGAYGGSPYI